MGSFISTASDFQRGRYWKGLCIKLKGHWFWMRSYITSPSLNIPVQIGRFAECNLFWLTLLLPSNIVVTENAKIWWKLYWFLKALPLYQGTDRIWSLGQNDNLTQQKTREAWKSVEKPTFSCKNENWIFSYFHFHMLIFMMFIYLFLHG